MPAHTTAKSITPGSRVQSGPVNTNYTALNTDMNDHIDGTNYRHPASAIDVAQRAENVSIVNVADDAQAIHDIDATLFNKILGPWKDGGGVAGVGYAQRAANMGALLGSLYDSYTRLGLIEANGWVTSARIADGTIATGDLADGAVTSVKIADLTIATGDIADGAITSAKIADLTIGTGDIADNAITSAKLAPGAVTLSDIMDGTITAVKIANDTITATQIAPNAITASELADNAVDTAAIADSAVTSVKIADGTIVGTDLAADTITATQIAANAITASELADGAVDTAAIQAGAVTTAKIATGAVTTNEILDATIQTGDIADSAITSVKIANGTIVAADIATGTITSNEIADGTIATGDLADGAVSTAKLADYAITQIKYADGAIQPKSPASLIVSVLPIRKWNDAGQPIEYTGGDIDLTSHVPGPTLKRYVLIEVNSTGAAYVKDGDPTSGTAIMPSRDPDTTPLGFVFLSAGLTQITAAQIFPWRGPFSGSGNTTGGSPVGHIHGLGVESRVTALGMDEGFARPTSTASLSIIINPLHYRSGAGQVQTYAGGTVGPFGVPTSPAQRIDGVYLDPASGSVVILAGTPHDTAPQKPAFSGNQRSIAYIHLRSTSTIIKAGDDTVNGWIEDARDWTMGGGVSSVPVGVAEGGSGVVSYTAGLLKSAGGTTPITTVTAPAGAVVGDTDAQTLTNKTTNQATASTIGVIHKQAASPTADTNQWQDSGAVAFGNVSQFKTFGFGARETTGSAKVAIGGTVAGASGAKPGYALLVNPTSVAAFDNTAASYGIANIALHAATGQTNAVAYGIYTAPARVGGDTGTFLTTAALYAIAASFGTTNYAILATGTVQATTLTATGVVNAQTAGSSITIEAWIAVQGGVGFTNSWANVGSTGANASYKKDSFGIIHVKGNINAGTASTAAFTLPVGYRPAQDRTFAVARKVGGVWGADACLVTSGGGVIPIQAGGAGTTNGYDLNFSFDPN